MKPELIDLHPSQVVTMRQLTKLTMCPSGMLVDLVRDGWIKKPTGDKYPLMASVQGWVGYLKSERRNAAAKSPKTKDARTREIELRIAQRQRLLVPIEETIAVVDRICGTFREGIEGMPARLTRDREEKERLQKGMDELLLQCTRIIEAEIAALKSGGDDSEADEKDDT